MVKITSPDRINDRKLEERSFLGFEFFEDPKNPPIVRILPFFENPDIEESRRSNYAKYQPLSRNSTLLAYTGSESRMFVVNFFLTLPNISEYFSTIFSNYASKYRSKTELRQLFYQKDSGQGLFPNPISSKALKGSAQDFDNFFNDAPIVVDTSQKSQGNTFPINQNNSRENIGPFAYATVQTAFVTSLIASDEIRAKDRQRIIDMVMYWVNLIRSSCLNNAKDPTLAPPIIRLNHGILYQDIPTVCLDYKINFAENAGYDLKTMLPRKIEISLNLQEVRVGDFGTYNVKNIIGRDNIVGWESVINGSNTIDPIRRDIGVRYL